MSRWGAILALLALLVIVAPSSPAQDMEPACANAGGLLLLAVDENALVLDPASNGTFPLSFSPAILQRAQRSLTLLARYQAPRWNVQRHATSEGYEFIVRDPDTGQVILSATFDRRIEIASSTVSPTGRFTVFIQANNLASEITVLDAAPARRLDLRIPHHEHLSAFAIASAFSPGETCLAVSMERAGGPGPQVWLVDLETGAIGPAHAGTIIGWI